jgi:vacuolar-type H+-ATPase subunit I/STV1
MARETVAEVSKRVDSIERGCADRGKEIEEQSEAIDRLRDRFNDFEKFLENGLSKKIASVVTEAVSDRNREDRKEERDERELQLKEIGARKDRILRWAVLILGTLNGGAVAGVIIALVTRGAG